MSVSSSTLPVPSCAPIAVETMRTLIVCRGPIAFETLEVYRHHHWQLPHVVVSSKEWLADLYRTAPWIADLPTAHVHYVQEYDDSDAILQLAQALHIDAIYPGYGFLAENATFAERVEQSGRRFVGPTPATLRAVGDKDSAIALAKQLAIPTIPGDDALIAFAHTQSQQALLAEAVRRTLAMAQRYPGYPIRLKHPAGGGGKGQRVLAAAALQAVEAPETIRQALSKVWSEIGVAPPTLDAQKGVLIELNLPRPLHWEVQLFGDGDTVVHMAARDCSLQNHGYQKFIEVALHPQALAYEMARLHPHAAADRLESLRQRQHTLEDICAAALRLGQAVHLRGAATVEFLIDEHNQPYFLEVNPRIQVEHGVTEGIVRVHGQPLSLVAWQQRVAAGERLNFRQADITFAGDAIEVRLNAWHEDLSPVLGGVIQSLRLHAPPASQGDVRVEASGLLQRPHPWVVPSYDANFALIIVSGPDRQETLQRLIVILDDALQVQGNADLQTNLQPLIGLLTLMQALPPETAFRTDTSLLWIAMTAVVASQKQAVLALLPSFPRQVRPHDPALYARLLRATLEATFTHPSRLLTYYLKRLTTPAPRPLTAIDVLWQLANALHIPRFAEEQQREQAWQQATQVLWDTLGASAPRLTALVQAATMQCLAQNPDYAAVLAQMQAHEPTLSAADAAALLHNLLGWLCVDLPAITALITALERTQLSTLLSANSDLSLTRPAYLQDPNLVAHLHRLLSHSLRPTMLRHGELLSPMEATIYHFPEPGAPSFVKVGDDVKVGQTLALLEAMKMFSELPSPVDGVVLEVLVANGQGVKTGTPLFKIATQEMGLEAADTALPVMITTGEAPPFGLLP